MKEKLVRFKFVAGFAAILVLAVIIPLTVSQINKLQESRSHASGEPVAIILTPTTKTLNAGDELDVDVKISGGQNNMSAVDITFDYSSTTLAIPSNIPNSFVPASTFTTISNSMSSSTGKIHYVGVNVGTNPITGTVSLGTFKFIAQGSGTATIGFSNIHVNASGVTGAVPVDTTNTVTGSYTVVGNAGGTTPTTTPTTDISPTAIPTGVQSSGATTLQLTLALTGIGAGSPNILNNNPVNATQSADVNVYDAQNNLILSTTGTVNYDPISGFFKGSIPLGTLAAGNYTVKTRLKNTLWKRLPGIIPVVVDTNNVSPTTTLVSGDFNGDNRIDLLDYNLLIACINHQGSCADVTSMGNTNNLIAIIKNSFKID
ncbi:MAG TPA: cohesin domain-containing protein [Patescibacteria group bacterium]|nr:cohesin domain-containing protein [Patescibacteria group bacterium]